MSVGKMDFLSRWRIQPKRCWQYWHSCIAERSWKTLSWASNKAKKSFPLMVRKIFLCIRVLITQSIPAYLICVLTIQRYEVTPWKKNPRIFTWEERNICITGITFWLIYTTLCAHFEGLVKHYVRNYLSDARGNRDKPIIVSVLVHPKGSSVKSAICVEASKFWFSVLLIQCKVNRNFRF